jgi:hypothetical protein
VSAKPRTDAKAGYCAMCRQGTHTLCASDTCTCTTAIHIRRPKFGQAHPELARGNGGGSPSPTRPSPAPAAKPPAKPALIAAVWELVRADPPAPPPKPRKLTAAERARPLLEQLMAEGDRHWHRLALFPSTRLAGNTRGQLVKAYPREWEFKAVALREVGQSSLYVRWLGDKAKAPL